MVQRGEELRFTLEPGQAVGVEREMIGKDFEGDIRPSVVSRAL
jgi:hypothetical protein